MKLKNIPPFETRNLRSSSERGKDDRQDCTVQALANVTALTYDEAHELLERHGRKRKRGFNIGRLLRLHPILNFFRFQPVGLEKTFKHFRKSDGWGERVRATRSKTMTVNQFVRTHPRGRFYLTTNTHAFALIDGGVVDNLRNPKFLCQLEEAFEVTMQ